MSRRLEQLNVLEFCETHHPLVVSSILWPTRKFYDKEIEMIESVFSDSLETVVIAGNQLGKDYTASFIALIAFMSNRIARVVNTSVKDDHLRVLWGEINNWIWSSAVPLTVDRGGPLIVNHRDVRKMVPGKQERCAISYLWGAVSAKGEGMAGHHAPYTLAIIDEASGVEDIVYTQMGTWAKRFLIFGNPNPTTNFFYMMAREGDIPLVA